MHPSSVQRRASANHALAEFPAPDRPRYSCDLRIPECRAMCEGELPGRTRGSLPIVGEAIRGTGLQACAPSRDSSTNIFHALLLAATTHPLKSAPAAILDL